MNLRSLLNLKALLFSNLSVKQTVAKNIFWLGFTEVIDRLSRFILLIFAARILGVQGYGKFSFAYSFAMMLAIFSDFGLDTITMREIAKNKKNKNFSNSAFGLKLILSIFTLILLFVLSFFISQSFEIQKIIFVVSFVVVFGKFSEFIISIFRAHQRMEYEALGKIVQVLITLILGLLILFKLPSAFSFSWAYFISGLLALILILFLYHKKIQPFRLSWDILGWKNLFLICWPLGFSAIFASLYNNFGLVMMGKMNQIKSVGYYSAAYKLILIILVPQILIYQSFFPVFSSFWKEARNNLVSIFSKYNELILALIVPIIVGGIVLADKIINFIYGVQYLSSILAFKILIFSTFFFYLASSWRALLIISDNQKKFFYVNLFGVLINIILNFILIPKYSLIGAAISFVLTQFSMAIIFYIFAKRIFITKIFRFFIIPLISSLVMYLFISKPFIYNQHIVLIILFGFVIYLLMFVVLRLASFYFVKFLKSDNF